MLIDLFGRKIDYLRISITDRCNLRCVYCMPGKNIQWLSKAEILSNDEILQVVRAAAESGIRKIRLSGGEPIVRPNLVELIRRVRDVPAIQDISLTTNGILLECHAQALTVAGLSRVNISMTSLDPPKFRRITHHGDLARVWRGLLAAEQSGLTPIKIIHVAIQPIKPLPWLPSQWCRYC